MFIDSFDFSSSSLDSLVKTLGKKHFKPLRQEIDCKLLDLVKHKRFLPDKMMRLFQKF